MTEFIIPGEPRGKGRPRFTRCGQPYTDEKTRAYERMVQSCFSAVGGTRTLQPVYVRITAYHGVPQSWNKRIRALALADDLPATRKPDADNIAKIILDALNGVAWKDDTQVVQLEVNKAFHAQPHVTVVIVPLMLDDAGKAVRPCE